MPINPTTVILVALIALLAISATLPGPVVTKCVLVVALAGAAYGVVSRDLVNESAEGAQVDALRRHVEGMQSSGYEKNNENVPLRRITRFRYIYVDAHVVKLLLELFRYETRYKDVVYSVVCYSEAFVRQVFRMMDGKVRDPQQARTLAERLLNHLHTLLYNASRYELDHMEDLMQRFTALVWGLYGHALERVGQGDQTHVPSAMDMLACDRFDLQLL